MTLIKQKIIKILHQWYWSELFPLNKIDIYNLNSYLNLICFSHINYYSSKLNYNKIKYFSSYTPNGPKENNKSIINNLKKFSNINHELTLSIIMKGLNHYSISTKVKYFIKENINIENPYLNVTDNIKLPISDLSFLFKDNSKKPILRHLSCIYAIRLLGTKEFYIVSTIDALSRYQQHKNKARINSNKKFSLKLYSKIRNVDHKKVSFEILHYTTNWFLKFKKINPNFILNENEIELIQLFTKYECAVIEQTFMSLFKPTLNERRVATTRTKLSFIDSISNQTDIKLNNKNNKILKNKTNLLNKILQLKTNTTPLLDISNWILNENYPVQFFNVEGLIIGSFPSQLKAASALGVSLQVHLISRYSKSTDLYNSPKLGILISIVIKNKEKIGKVIHSSFKIYDILKHNLNLTLGKLCALSSDLKTIVGAFDSFFDAAKFFDVSNFRRIRRYFGTDKLIKTPKGVFYFTGTEDILTLYNNKTLFQIKFNCSRYNR